MWRRLVVSIALLSVVSAAIYISHRDGLAWIYWALLTAGVVLAQWEYYRMAEIKGHRPMMLVGCATTMLYLLALFVAHRYPITFVWPQVVLLAGLIAGFVAFFFPRPDPLENLAVTAFGVVYLALPLGAILSITYFDFHGHWQDGRWWLIYLIAVTKITDIAALAVGKLMGKRPLALRISPNKTVEGGLGGFLAAIATSLLFAYLANSHVLPIQLSYIQAIWLGVLFGVISQIGDLSESVLKRDAKLKNSSYLPGLGGALDVLDSIVFTAPLLLFFLYGVAD